MKPPRITYKGIRKAPAWAKEAAKAYALNYAAEGRNRTLVEVELRPKENGDYQLVIFRGLKLWMPTITEYPEPKSMQVMIVAEAALANS